MSDNTSYAFNHVVFDKTFNANNIEGEYLEDDYGDHGVSNFIFIVDGIILTLVSCFGIIGTFMSIIILVKTRLRGISRDHFSTFLTALAVYDSLFLIVAILLFGLPSLSMW